MREPYHDPLPLRWLKAWHLPVAVEYVILAVLLFVPFGFDHPSSWGLDFDHWIVVFGLLIVASLGALTTCLFERTAIGLLLTLVPWVLLYLYFVRH